MIFSFDLLINAIVSGILIGGFYAAVTSGVSLSFGILDIVNIAHPAFIILGSYVAYAANSSLGVDPILASIVAMPEYKTMIENSGEIAMSSTPEQLAQVIKQTRDDVVATIQEFGLQQEQ